MLLKQGLGQTGHYERRQAFIRTFNYFGGASAVR